MAEEIIWVDIDDLGIDIVNVRGGEWDYDKEFVCDIKNNGVRTPLTVREAGPETGKKYAIVCGSRRYNASIEAGLDKVPCFIEKLDDVTATGWSIAENKHRKDIPAWRYALKMGEMYQQLKLEGKKSEIVKMMIEKTGFSENTVYDYLAISSLPAEITELMKEPSKRSKKVKELLKKFSTVTVGKILSYDKAAKIARRVTGFPPSKIFEVGAYVIPLIREEAFEIIEGVKTYPEKSIKEIHDIVAKVPRGSKCELELSASTTIAVDGACMDKQIDRKRLITDYLEHGLRRDGYLQEEKITNGQKKVD